MKQILKIAALFLLFATVFIYGCKKTSMFDENGNIEPNTEFNANVVKTWYYKTFQNTEEAQLLNKKEQKYPVWKNGIYHKEGKFEVMEFPLISNSKQISLLSSLPVADKKRIATATLQRIKFTKNEQGQIFVTEVMYIPDLQYLQKKNFDISTTSYGTTNDDFTGIMTVKKWSGELLSKIVLNNGKIIGKKSITKNNSNATSRANRNEPDGNFIELDCADGIEMCEMEQLCWVHPDGMVISCGEWELVPGSCFCEPNEGGDEDDLPDDCELHGTGCGGGGGNGNGDNEDEVDDCAPVDDNPKYQSFLSMTNVTTSDDVTLGQTTMISSTIKSNPVIWKPVHGAWGEVTSIETLTREQKFVGNNLIWTIKDITHSANSLSKSFLMSLSPHNVELSLISFTPNIPNVLTATMQATGKLEFSFCGVHVPSRDYDFNKIGTAHAYD